MTILRLILLAFLWCLMVPAALVLALVISTPQVLMALLNGLELILDLAWLLVAVCFHLLRSSLFALGFGGREKALLIKTQARHFAGEVKEDAKKVLALPLDLARNFRRVLARLRPRLHRRTGDHRELTADRAAATPPTQAGYGFESEYRIVERLPPGGSTAQLFVIVPRRQNLPEGRGPGDRLVLKYFDLTIGSHLENIVRESGAVKLATQLGIVLDSKMTPTSFYYVMPYYQGGTLTGEILKLHRELPEASPPADGDLKRFLGWLRDLLAVIVEYHQRGVFHKDIKPDNLIVEGERLHLIDIGLLTPLESTLQLTTHGTEYFRDPEMVRLAARGAAIRDVDCAKFDLYSLGAVLYFMAEGGFPASGSLTRYSRRVPFPLQWISNRAMADFDKRYASAREMLEDVEALRELSSGVPLDSVKVSSLPSFGNGEPPPQVRDPAPAPRAIASPPASSGEGKGRNGAARHRRLGAVAILLAAVAAGAAAGSSFLHLNVDQLAASSGGFESAALDDPGTTRRFSSRSEAAGWLAEAIRRDRSRETGGSPRLTPVRFTLPGPEEDPEAREFLRELKLALAERGVRFSTQSEAYPPGEARVSPWALRLEAVRGSGRRMVGGEVNTPAGPRAWSAEYP
jgi:serine/threonine protein kinase